MSDPFYLADILLGRVGVLRSTAESIVIELCEAQSKLDAQANDTSESAGGDPGTSSALVASSPDDALRLAIKNKLERVQTNLKLLRKLVPEFGALRGRLWIDCVVCVVVMTGLLCAACVIMQMARRSPLTM